MPLIDIRTNFKYVPDDFITNLSEQFAKDVGKKTKDIEVCLTTDATIQFNGNIGKPAAYISYKTTDQQFEVGERRVVVKSLSHLIGKQLGIKSNRVFIQLQQLAANEVGIGGHLFLDIVAKSKL